jgi:transcriptional regulator with XRE-family HTH domain
MSLIQISRYENGSSQPTLDVIRKLSASADDLVFDEDERAPDDELRLQFDAISRFGPAEQETAKDVLDGPILKHKARR